MIAPDIPPWCSLILPFIGLGLIVVAILGIAFIAGQAPS